MYNKEMKNVSHGIRNKSQSGSALFIVLIAVALFGALSFAVSTMMRDESGLKLVDEKAGLYANEILDYGRAVREAVQNIRISNGCSDTDISFQNSSVTGYTNGTNTACQIFHANGGGLNYIGPTTDSLDPSQSAKTGYSQWYFLGESCVNDVGTGTQGCWNANGASDSDLVAALPWIKKDVCIEINDRLGITNPSGEPPQANGRTWNNAMPKFTGVYTQGGHAIQSEQSNVEILKGKTAGCFEGETFPQTGTYSFYQVLIAR